VEDARHQLIEAEKELAVEELPKLGHPATKKRGADSHVPSKIARCSCKNTKRHSLGAQRDGDQRWRSASDDRRRQAPSACSSVEGSLLWPSAALPGQGNAGTARAGDCSKISPCLNSQPGAPSAAYNDSEMYAQPRRTRIASIAKRFATFSSCAAARGFHVSL
jgi:hypothetical protein